VQAATAFGKMGNKEAEVAVSTLYQREAPSYNDIMRRGVYIRNSRRPAHISAKYCWRKAARATIACDKVCADSPRTLCPQRGGYLPFEGPNRLPQLLSAIALSGVRRLTISEGRKGFMVASLDSVEKLCPFLR